MSYRFSLPVLYLSGLIYAPSLFAQTIDAQVVLDYKNPSYTNTETISVGDGYGVWVDGLTGFNGSLTNSENITVSGKGYGIYETPYQTRPVNMSIYNTGLIQRIQLEQTDGEARVTDPNNLARYQYMRNYGKNPAVLSNQGEIQGEVSLGVNNTINNNGVFSNFDLDDSSFAKGNLISLGHNGLIKNGIEWDWLEKELDEDGLLYTGLRKAKIKTSEVKNDYAADLKEVRTTTFNENALISTDKIQFAGQGILVNGGIINNQSIVFGDNGYFYNIGNAYNSASIKNAADYVDLTPATQTTSDTTDTTPETPDTPEIPETPNTPPPAELVDYSGGTITTQKLVLGNNSILHNEMGATLSISDLSTGSNNSIKLGADYQLAEPAILEFTNGEKTLVGTFTTIQQTSDVNIKHADLGANNTVIIDNKVNYTGETLKTANNNKIDIIGSTVNVKKDDGSGLIDIGNNSTVTLKGGKWEEVKEPYIIEIESENGEPTYSLEERTLRGEAVFDTVVSADTFKMGDNANLSLTQGESVTFENGKTSIGSVSLNTTNSIFGNNAIVSVTSNPENEFYSTWTATEQIRFGNNAQLLNASSITTTDMIFANSGIFTNTGFFDAQTLTMGENSTIETWTDIPAFTTLGSNSIAILNGAYSSELPASDEIDIWKPAGTFTNGITKANGAENVQIVSRTKALYDADNDIWEAQYGYLTGGVNVDNIIVESGELRVSGDVKGRIGINSNSQLRIVDTDIMIHDPINKLANTENTKLIIDLDGSDHYYRTSNTINVDRIILEGGGFEINTPVQAKDITLGSNTAVRLKGNYYVGDMKELYGDSANTTLAVDAGTDKEINSTGIIRVDRVVAESGTFNINHKLEAVYTNDSSSMPSASEQGMELNTDAVINVNAADVKVNRIVRGQLAQQLGKNVTNTTVTMNDGTLNVERNVDVDQLNIKKGLFEFENKDTTNVINIKNALTVHRGGHFAGAGLVNMRNGDLTINEGARLSVSTKLVKDKPIDTMEIMQSEHVYSDSTDVTDKGSATVNLKSGSILDLRADNGISDKIEVSGTVNIEDDMRLILRNIEANQNYELISATQLNGNIDEIQTSFLWKGTQLTNNNGKLNLQVADVQTLKQGIAPVKHSENIVSIADAMDKIHNRTASNTIDPFLDHVFYAQTAESAVQVMDEYSPEGYLNLQHAAARTNRTFRQSAIDELTAMRTYRDVENMFGIQQSYSYNPNYYGRPGYEQIYGNWNNQQTRRRRTRTDKGGIWAKPFMTSLTQDDKENMSGFEFSNYGLTAGIDRRFGSIAIGMMGLYASGSLEQNNKVIESDITTYGAGVYGYYRPSRSRQFVNVYGLWTQSKNEAKHKINSLVESANADFNMTAYSVGGEYGVDLPLSRSVIITPKVGIDYTTVSMDEIEEKGTGLARVKVTPDDMTSIQTPVEVRATFNLGAGNHRFKPELHARWTHEFGDTAGSGKGLFVKQNQPFGVKGLNADEDTFTLGGSLLWLYNVSELEVKYDYDFSSSSTGHSVNASYKYLF